MGERKTEWNENSISGRKKIMSKGEAAEMRMDCFSGHEKPPVEQRILVGEEWNIKSDE